MSQPPKELTGLVRLGDDPLFKKHAREFRPPSRIQSRLTEAVAAKVEHPEEALEILYQHSTLCQTYLPYRDPGNEVRTWARINGKVHLEINAGKVMHPDKGLVPVSLPFGPKARLILMHINQEAIKKQSPVIEIQSSLTSFVSRLKLDSHGRNMRTVKDQLARLSASSVRLGVVKNGCALTINSQIVTAFNIWFPKDDRQKVLWPSTIKLSTEYFESLQDSAVPLDEGDLAALSHSSLALDIYAWLAQRLYRVPSGRLTLVRWTTLQDQFAGVPYDRLRDFRRAFKTALGQVTKLYSAARVEVDYRGLTLRHSPPPVPPRFTAIGG